MQQKLGCSLVHQGITMLEKGLTFFYNQGIVDLKK